MNGGSFTRRGRDGEEGTEQQWRETGPDPSRRRKGLLPKRVLQLEGVRDRPGCRSCGRDHLPLLQEQGRPADLPFRREDGGGGGGRAPEDRGRRERPRSLEDF